MEAKYIDGERIATDIKESLRCEIKGLREKGIIPHLEAILVGDNVGARIYAKNQEKASGKVGISYKLNYLPESTSQDELIELIEKLNQDSNITGIILQMPLPSHINGREVQMRISPSKDVEGVHPFNVGRLLYGKTVMASCTALAIMELLKSTNIPLKGKEVTIVGHSEIVGKPLLLMLLQSLLESPTPTVCHIATKDLAFHTKRAEVLIVAVGRAGLIKGDMIKEGAIVIDVGINRILKKNKDGSVIKKIVGDVVFEEAVKKASFITPVPGGVGPVTTAMLLKNTVEATKMLKKEK